MPSQRSRLFFAMDFFFGPKVLQRFVFFRFVNSTLLSWVVWLIFLGEFWIVGNTMLLGPCWGRVVCDSVSWMVFEGMLDWWSLKIEIMMKWYPSSLYKGWQSPIIMGTKKTSSLTLSDVHPWIGGRRWNPEKSLLILGFKTCNPTKTRGAG